jgi:hypothetical protein
MKETISVGIAIALKETQTKCFQYLLQARIVNILARSKLQERGCLNSVSQTNWTFDETQRKDNLWPFISIVTGLATNGAEFPQRGTNLPPPPPNPQDPPIKRNRNPSRVNKATGYKMQAGVWFLTKAEEISLFVMSKGVLCLTQPPVKVIKRTVSPEVRRQEREVYFYLLSSSKASGFTLWINIFILAYSIMICELLRALYNETERVLVSEPDKADNHYTASCYRAGLLNTGSQF